MAINSDIDIFTRVVLSWYVRGYPKHNHADLLTLVIGQSKKGLLPDAFSGLYYTGSIWVQCDV